MNHILFFVGQPETWDAFCTQWNVFVHSLVLARLDFAYEPNARYGVKHHRVTWKNPDGYGREAAVSLILVGERSYPFYFFLDMPLSGSFFVSSAHITHVGRDIEGMRRVLPKHITERSHHAGCVYFPKMEADWDASHLSGLSKQLGLSIYVEKEEKIGNLCGLLLHRILGEPKKGSVAQSSHSSTV